MSRRLSRLVMLGALGLGGLGVPAALVPPATAAGETCRGLPATIVGAHGERVKGTTGPDVIVSNGAKSVDGGDGDDVICTTDTVDDVYVSGGSGTDVVDRSNDLSPANPRPWGFINLEGADEFVGSADPDQVWDQNPTTGRIATGAGNDSIRLYGRKADPHVELDGGDGTDTLDLDTHLHGLWTIDFRTGTRPTTTRTITGVGLETFSAGSGLRQQEVAAREKYRFLGSAANETVYLPAPQVRLIRMGGGDDIVTLTVPGHFPPSVRRPVVDGGSGTDEVGVGSIRIRDEVVFDLADDRLDLRFGNAGPPQYRIPGFENVSAIAGAARIAGDDGPNVLTTNACPEVMRGRGGDDVLVFSDHVKFTKTCEEPGQRFVMYGGAGDDQLEGSPFGNDLLIGGPGVDSANGRQGEDSCEAETTVACETTPS